MSPSEIEINLTFQCFAIGLTVLWLTAHKFRKLHGLLRFLLYLAIMVLVLLLGFFSSLSDFNNRTAMVLLLFIPTTIAMLFGFACAGKFCRKKYRPKAFMLWSLLSMPICGIIAMMGYIISVMVFMNETPPKEIFIQVFIVGLIVGLLLYALNLPFLIVGFVSPFYRERFCDFLRLKTELESVEEENKVQPIGQSNSV
jgi:amino acid transporter